MVTTVAITTAVCWKGKQKGKGLSAVLGTQFLGTQLLLPQEI